MPGVGGPTVSATHRWYQWCAAATGQRGAGALLSRQVLGYYVEGLGVKRRVILQTGQKIQTQEKNHVCVLSSTCLAGWPAAGGADRVRSPSCEHARALPVGWVVEVNQGGHELFLHKGRTKGDAATTAAHPRQRLTVQDRSSQVACVAAESGRGRRPLVQQRRGGPGAAFGYRLGLENAMLVRCSRTRGTAPRRPLLLAC